MGTQKQGELKTFLVVPEGVRSAHPAPKRGESTKQGLGVTPREGQGPISRSQEQQLSIA